MPGINEVRNGSRSLPPFTPETWRRFAERFQWTESLLHTVQLLCQGLSNKQIAKRLGCGVDNVNKRLGQVYKSIGVSGRTAVAPRLTEIYFEFLASNSLFPPPPVNI